MTRFHVLGTARGRRRSYLRTPEIADRFSNLVRERHCFDQGSGNCEDSDIMISVNISQI